MAGPLAGVRVLDFGMAAVGPLATTYLGLLGADVIKIEQPTGDIVRRPSGPTMQGMGITFIANNYTKRGLCLDLKKDEDREIAFKLVATADVVLDNFRSGDIMERLGLGYKVQRTINPQIIYLQASAYGNRGPWKGMLSHEWMTQAAGGYTSLNGKPGGEPEFLRGTANLDWNGAMINCIGLLAALYLRRKTGRGMKLETSQLHTTILAGLTRYAEYFTTGTVPDPMGSSRPNIVPDQAFPTALGDISVSAVHNGIWARLCAALGRQELLTDTRFVTNTERVKNREVLIPLLEATFKKKAAWQWEQILKIHGVPCALYLRDKPRSHFVTDHPQTQANQMIETIYTPWGPCRVSRAHWRFSRDETSIPRPAPQLGEHQKEILRELGLTEVPTRASAA
jgi:crotonobetainyl-CoA:carnitine CoA-transferase CaiB-like acyl-CoA transferase